METETRDNITTNLDRSQVEDVTIVPLQEGDLRSVTRVHQRAFAGYPNVLLGTGYLLPFFRWFIHARGAIAVVAVTPRRRVVGYAVGAPVSHGRQRNHDLFWIVVRQVLSRPSLWVNWKFSKIVIARLRSFLIPRSAHNEQQVLPEPRMSLVALGTSPDRWRKGIGTKLMRAFVERAEQLEMCSVSLSVYQDNLRARAFYDRSGWITCGDEESGHSPSVIYYKTIAQDRLSCGASRKGSTEGTAIPRL